LVSGRTLFQTFLGPASPENEEKFFHEKNFPLWTYTFLAKKVVTFSAKTAKFRLPLNELRGGYG
jgi:hypothetical protein